MSASLANAYRSSIDLPAMYIATTALLLSQNGLRSNLRASDFNFLGEHSPPLLHVCAWMDTCNSPSENLAWLSYEPGSKEERIHQ